MNGLHQHLTPTSENKTSSNHVNRGKEDQYFCFVLLLLLKIPVYQTRNTSNKDLMEAAGFP